MTSRPVTTAFTEAGLARDTRAAGDGTDGFETIDTADAVAQRVRRLGPASRGPGSCDWTDGDDLVACEEPLEIQLGPASLAVVMRTPGHDEELALGFAITERIVAAAGDIASVHHCADAGGDGDNVIRIVPATGVAIDFERLRRNLYASSSCGICGKATIDNALDTAPPLVDDAAFAASTIRRFPTLLGAAQEGFRRSGGLHAAGLFDRGGNLLVVREDVGRHNAVDKVVGWAASRGLLPLGGHALMVSGRVSFEIVQKALAARIPLVAAVSAPTSLAVDLASQAGIALVGFLRGETMNVYANAARVTE